MSLSNCILCSLTLTVYEGGIGMLLSQGLKLPRQLFGTLNSRGHEDLIRFGALLEREDRNKPRDSYISVSTKNPFLCRSLVSVVEKLGGVAVYQDALYLVVPEDYRQPFKHLI